MTEPDFAPLRALFEPGSIAIVGASEDTQRMGGGLVLKFVRQHGFAGSIFPVNPKYAEVAGLECHPSLESIAEPVDLAVLAVPAAAVANVLRAVPRGHVKVALVLTSGFAELGAAGETLEQEMVAIARDRGLRVVGPNSVGSVNLWHQVVTTISQLFDREGIEPGNVALVSQSGAFATALLAQADLEGLRFGHFVSSGNEADLEFSDFARYLLDDPRVTVICGYLEGVKNGAAFVDFARRACAAGKPVVVLKVGATEAAAAAAKSHTGALVGSDAVVQAVFDAHNIVRAADGENLLDLLKVFTRTPVAGGRRLAILSHSGGAGVMAVDAVESAGAEIPALPQDLRDRLTEMLPPFASVNNPLDMTGGASFQAKLMADCLRVMLGHDAFDAALLCVNLIWREGSLLMQELTDIRSTFRKPFAVSWVAPDAVMARALRDAPFPVFPDPARAARVLTRRLVFDERHRVIAARPDAGCPFQVTGGARESLAGVAGQGAVLRGYGIRLPRECLADSLEAAETFRREVGQPIALKIASPDIRHRTEIDGVVTDIADAAGLAAAYDGVLSNAKRRCPEARVEGVLVQEMIHGGAEALIGAKRDPVFGPIIAFGPGGTLVELIDQVRLHPAPMSAAQAEEMVAMSPMHVLVGGYRGGEKLDAPALVDTLMRVSWLAADRPEILELDLNPVVVLSEGNGCVALDYKFTLETGEGA